MKLFCFEALFRINGECCPKGLYSSEKSGSGKNWLVQPPSGSPSAEQAVEPQPTASSSDVLCFFSYSLKNWLQWICPSASQLGSNVKNLKFITSFLAQNTFSACSNRVWVQFLATLKEQATLRYKSCKCCVAEILALACKILPYDVTSPRKRRNLSWLCLV